MFLDVYDLFYFRDKPFEMLFDPHFESHLTHRTSGTVTLQGDFYDTVVGNFHEFYIAAVSLQSRTDILKDFFYFFFLRRFYFSIFIIMDFL